jgi:hypothetical protein
MQVGFFWHSAANNARKSQSGGRIIFPLLFLTRASAPGLPDGIYFQTKNPILGKFWRVYIFWTFGLLCSNLVCFTAIWSILRPFDIFYDHLLYFVVIWYIFPPVWYVVPRNIWQPCESALLYKWIFIPLFAVFFTSTKK